MVSQFKVQLTLLEAAQRLSDRVALGSNAITSEQYDCILLRISKITSQIFRNDALLTKFLAIAKTKVHMYTYYYKYIMIIDLYQGGNAYF